MEMETMQVDREEDEENDDLRVVEPKKFPASRVVIIIGLIIAAGLIIVLAINVAIWSSSGVEELGSSWQESRLPGDVLPYHYDVSIKVSLDPEFLSEGSVKIFTTCNQTTTHIILHSKHHTVNTDATRITDTDDGSSVKVVGYEFRTDLDYLIVTLATALQPGYNYTLYFEFSGEIDDSLIGLYKSSYIDSTGVRHWLAVTQFSPAEARRMMPGFDEPAMKATFRADVTHSANLTALSNMPVVGNTTLPDGWIKTQFDTTVKMSLYLLTFVISDFNYTETYFSDDRPFRVWCPPDSVDQTQYSLEKGAEIINYFESYFNIKYPLPKMDMVAVPDFGAGAMENWGLMLFRETRLLLDLNSYTDAEKENVVAIVSHELVHQWFGNLVTADWWSDIWINEGFASYLEYKGTQHAEPTGFDWESVFIRADMDRALTADYMPSSPSIVRTVDTYNQINEIFSTIIYRKGSSVLRMMEHFIGEETMRKGLQYFLEEFQYSVANTDQFWASMQTAVDENNLENIPDIKTIMDTWTRQAGYPYITIDTQIGDNQLHITQKHFLLSADEDETDERFWYVPVTLSSAGHTSPDDTTLIWLPNTESETTLPVDGEGWIIGNPYLHNFYIVNYDDSNWQKLIETLKTTWTEIPTVNRAGLIRNAFDIAKLGEVNIGIAFNTTSYLPMEESSLPIRTALSQLLYVSHMLRTTAAYTSFREYLLAMLTPLYNKYDWTVDALTSDEQYIQNAILARVCGLGLQECVDAAVVLFTAWQADPDDNQIKVEWRSTVYCTAVGNGGVEEWEFLWDQYQSSTDAHHKISLSAGMACSRIPWLLYRMLNDGLDTMIVKEQDYVTFITGVAYSEVGADLAWTFFKDNYDIFYERYGDGLFNFEKIVTAVTYTFKTDYQLAELESFVETHSDQLGSAASAFDAAISWVKLNQRWVSYNYNDVMEWMEHYGLG